LKGAAYSVAILKYGVAHDALLPGATLGSRGCSISRTPIRDV
jgi:hypothetical protein